MGNPNAIRARSIKDGSTSSINPSSPVAESKVMVPTFTVSEDGELNIPTPSIEAVEAENEIEPTTAPHRFEPRVKPSRTSLDSVTYIGFVDFTTTIDDTVVIFRPKKTFSTASRNVLVPKIQPTRTRTFPQHPPSSSTVIPRPSPLPDLESSEPERHRTSPPETSSAPTTPIPDSEVAAVTSGINPLKSLLAASASRRNFFSKTGNPRPRLTVKPRPVPASSARPAGGLQIRPSARPNILSRPKVERPSRVQQQETPKEDEPEPLSPTPDLSGSIIDPNSDVELVYKTLYTTYTYFTTFFRASTTRVKSREEVISNVVTLTNILQPSDLASLRSSCEVDSTCIFASTASNRPPAFTSGFIGRPNSRESVSPAERPRSRARKPVEEEQSLVEVDGIFKTFYTTYTYFTTYEVDGEATVSSRTEVYSNVKSDGVPVSVSDVGQLTILPTPSSLVAIEKTADPSPRRLEYSSIARDVSLVKDLTTTPRQEEEQETETTPAETTTTTTTTDSSSEASTTEEDEEDEEEVVLGVTTESTVTETVPDVITPTPALATTTEEEQELEEVAEEIVEGVEAVNAEVQPTPVLKTFYTTFTYFTTLFRNGTSFVTSNLETVANAASGASVSPSQVQPSVTFFTTFTYWTTSIDGDRTVITSSEETKTDVLPASVTDQIGSEISPSAVQQVSASAIRFTERPEVQAGVEATPSSSEAVVEATASPIDLESSQPDSTPVAGSASATATPTLQSSKQGFEDIDDEFTLVSKSSVAAARPSSISRSSSSKVKAFTPVIRPNLFRTRGRPNVRPRVATRTTVAIITRSDVTPTLIATPASAGVHATPTFESNRVLASSSLIVRGSGRFSSSSRVGGASSSALASSSAAIHASSVKPGEIEPTVAQDPAVPSIIPNLRLRRPNPFRARLKERQRLQLKKLREESNKDSSPSTPSARVPVPRFPAGIPGRTPIFVSSRTETVRRPKGDTEETSSEATEASAAAPTTTSTGRGGASPGRLDRLRIQRERARSRINTLFRRRRPSSLLKPKLTTSEEGSAADETETLAVAETRRRRKRQVIN